MEVFRSHGKIYEASASQMFKVPIEKSENPTAKEDRELLVTAGSWSAEGNGCFGEGLKEEEPPELVETWSFPNPQSFILVDVGDAAVSCKNKSTVQVHHGISFHMRVGVVAQTAIRAETVRSATNRRTTNSTSRR